MYIDGEEVEWGDYVDEVPSESLLLGFWNENGWGDGSDEVYLVAASLWTRSALLWRSRPGQLSVLWLARTPRSFCTRLC